MKIKIHNNWENLTYKFGKQELEHKKGTVTFKDGTELPMVCRTNHTSVYDHGHTYQVTQYKFFVKGTFRGIDIEVPIEKFPDIDSITQ